MSPSAPRASVTLVVPVKTLSHAKSRLHDLPRADLMRAFAFDALAAAVASPRVRAAYVVTAEDDLADGVRALGCRVLPDRGAGDLNAALRAAVRETASPGPVAALLGDLPCLLTDDLTQALDWVLAAGSGFVGDADGTGTTLLAVGNAGDFRPAFGLGSYAAHLAAGYPSVPLDVPTLRRDVDTAADLDAARVLGLGPATRAVLAT